MAGHPLDPAAPAADDPCLDERIREGLARAITEHGYAGTAVADIARRAGLPVSAVYERYGDKEACFLALYRDSTTRLLQGIEEADEEHARAGLDWRARVREGARAHLAALAAAPAVTQVAMLEIISVGPAGRRERRASLDRYAEVLDRLSDEGVRHGLDVRRLGPHRALAACGAVEELLIRHIETIGAERLTELAAPVADVLITLMEQR